MKKKCIILFSSVLSVCTIAMTYNTFAQENSTEEAKTSVVNNDNLTFNNVSNLLTKDEDSKEHFKEGFEEYSQGLPEDRKVIVDSNGGIYGSDDGSEGLCAEEYKDGNLVVTYDLSNPKQAETIKEVKQIISDND